MKKTTRHQHSKGFPQWRRLRYRPVQDNHGYWTQTCRFCHIVEWVLNNNEVNNIRAMICLFREDTWRNDNRRSEQLSNDMPLQVGHMNKWLQAFWTIERENHESYDMLKTNDWNAKCIQRERLKYNLWLSKHSLQDPSPGWEGEAWATDPQSSPSRQQDRPKWQ